MKIRDILDRQSASLRKQQELPNIQIDEHLLQAIQKVIQGCSTSIAIWDNDEFKCNLPAYILLECLFADYKEERKTRFEMVKELRCNLIKAQNLNVKCFTSKSYSEFEIAKLVGEQLDQMIALLDRT